jgi:hypothetical protein
MKTRNMILDKRGPDSNSGLTMNFEKVREMCERSVRDEAPEFFLKEARETMPGEESSPSPPKYGALPSTIRHPLIKHIHVRKHFRVK